MSKRKYKSHIKTNNTIIINYTEGPPSMVTKESSAYKHVEELLNAKMFDDVALAADIALRIERRSKGKFKISTENLSVYLGDDELPTALRDRLIDMSEQGLDTKPLELLWTNIKKNESAESRKDLYGFLMANKIPITKDGHFLAYKKVRDDFKDGYTGKFDNKPGTTVKMNRSEVDNNRDNTCSSGLHVAAWNYANQFDIMNGRLLEVKVNPADVVAVPPDYNQQKMRVCKYQVIGLAKDERKQLLCSVKVPEDKTNVTNTIRLDNRGRLQVPVKLLSKYLNTSFVAVRVDKRCDDRVRITRFNGRGLKLKVTRLGIYVPKDMLSQAGLGNIDEFTVKFENDGLSVMK